MKLSDIMSHMGLAIYPMAALVIFLTVFVFILVGLCGRRKLEEFKHAAGLPLADDAFEPDAHHAGQSSAEVMR